MFVCIGVSVHLGELGMDIWIYGYKIPRETVRRFVGKMDLWTMRMVGRVWQFMGEKSGVRYP